MYLIVPYNLKCVEYKEIKNLISETTSGPAQNNTRRRPYMQAHTDSNAVSLDRTRIIRHAEAFSHSLIEISTITSILRHNKFSNNPLLSLTDLSLSKIKIYILLAHHQNIEFETFHGKFFKCDLILNLATGYFVHTYILFKSHIGMLKHFLNIKF